MATGTARAREALVQFERGLLGPGEVLVLVLTNQEAVVRRKVVKGRALTSKEVHFRLASAEAAIDHLTDTRATDAAPPLSVAEATLLDQFHFGAPPDNARSELARSRVELELMIRGSLSITEAAKALGVTTSRIRQRLTSQRSLYGLKEGRDWRIPTFQFAGKGKLVRHIEVVLPHLRAEAHPLAVKSWFTQPHQDLVVGEADQRVSPIDWLASGRSPAVVAELAAEV